MDIFAHGLWGGIAAKGVSRSGTLRRRLGITAPVSTWRTALWGMFPDLFAFTLPFVWLAVGAITGTHSFSELNPAPDTSHAPTVTNHWTFALAGILYRISHSAIVFAAVFLLIWYLLKHPVFELGGWLLHILIDIPTHTRAFFPTPFLWPLSDYTFNGLSWATPWFLAANYLSIFLAYLYLRNRGKRRSAKV